MPEPQKFGGALREGLTGPDPEPVHMVHVYIVKGPKRN